MPENCAAVPGFMLGYKTPHRGSHRNPSLHSPSHLQEDAQTLRHMAQGHRWLSCNRRRQTDEIMKDAFCKVLLFSMAFGVGTLTAQTTPPNCPNFHDSNGNNTIDIQDFLSLLGVFQDVDVDYDGIWDSEDDCTDAEACNYAANPTESCAYIDVLGICGGGCEGDGDGDGICDDVDTCVGELDECGVCNGPGPTEIVIEDITILYDSVYAENIDTWFVYELGADTTFSITCAQDQNLVINELNLITGPDVGQFVELYGDPGTSLDGHSLVLVKSTFDANGSVPETQSVVDLGGASLDDDGFFLIEGENWHYNIVAVVLAASPATAFEVETEPAFDGVSDAVLYGSAGITHPLMSPLAALVSPDATETVNESNGGEVAGPYGLSRVPDGGEAFDQAFVLQGLSPGTTNELPNELPFTCGDPILYQGYDYATVLIGDQCWFAENLRNENYANGDAIPAGLSDSEWENTTSGAVAVYGEDAGCDDYSPDIDACDPAQSLNEYGRLYNWYAVDDARGLCPSGWHVPTDEEWTVMTAFLGGEFVAGGQMKTVYGWYNFGGGTNSSGFSGLPGGDRSSNGNFIGAGSGGFWWTSSPNGSFAWGRFLEPVEDTVYRLNGFTQPYGFSVRCIQDTE